MAKVKFGAMMVDMRGKLGGQVFSKNRGGAYVRTKVTPSNPQTADQVAQRARLSEFSQDYRGLTEAQRLAWAGAVSQFQTTNVFGDIVNPTGSTLYTRININIALAGGTAVLVPPTPLGVETPSDVTITADASPASMLLNWLPTPTPAGHQMIVEATPQLSAGISNANNKFRIIGSLPPATATDEDIIALYTAKFGAPIAGKKVFVRVKFIRIATGEVSQSLVASTIVVA